MITLTFSSVKVVVRIQRTTVQQACQDIIGRQKRQTEDLTFLEQNTLLTALKSNTDLMQNVNTPFYVEWEETNDRD